MSDGKEEAFHRRIINQVVRGLSAETNSSSDVKKLNETLRLLGKWRSVLLQDMWLRYEGNRVATGPFQGMELARNSGEGCHIAKLMGVYEQPLWSIIETVIRRKYEYVLNVGAAEGYYAIGLARRMPGLEVVTYESNPVARQILEKLVHANGVDSQVVLREACSTSSLLAYQSKRLLLICDIEGEEFNLFSGSAHDYLRNSDMIVEVHDVDQERARTTELVLRYRSTHHIEFIQDNGLRTFRAPDWFNQLPHLDQLICTWEWRSNSTPWLFMTAKNSA